MQGQKLPPPWVAARYHRTTSLLHPPPLMPILLYGLEALNMNKSQLNSLDFMANRFLMKLFNTNNMQIIEFCCEQFNFVLPSSQIAKST